MQIWVFLFASDGVNLAMGGETTGAHPQAGTALDRLVFAYIFPFLPLFYCSVFAKNHDVWMTGAYYYLTSSDISFVYLSVCLSVPISGFFQHCVGKGRECGYGIFVCFCFLLYISRGLLEGSVCFVSCTAGAGTRTGLAAVGLGLLVNALVGWG